MKGPVSSVTPQAVHQWQLEGRRFTFLDIREINEVTVSRLTDVHIPMAFCLSRMAEIPRNHPVVVYCRSGSRSAATVSALSTKHGFTNLHSLVGGITAWMAEYSPETEVG